MDKLEPYKITIIDIGYWSQPCPICEVGIIDSYTTTSVPFYEQPCAEGESQGGYMECCTECYGKWLKEFI